MDFFAGQEHARRQTGRLVTYFGLAVVAITAAVYLVVTLLVSFSSSSSSAHTAHTTIAWWNPNILVISTGATLVVILLGSLYQTLRLGRTGGAGVAKELGGRPIPPNTIDVAERRLLNVVEEMAIASGTPIPPVYLLEDEGGINAFAAGYRPADAVIGVTKGALNRLNRDELQGVIGHEFSHILNGDMRLNIRLIGLLHGILMLAIIGETLVRVLGRSRSSNRRGGGGLTGIVLFGLALMAIGYIGVFFGKLIKSAVSRQREFLADASSAQFTRNPAGLADALKKIGGLTLGARISTPRAEEASHMFFGNARGNSFAGFMATHPPLADRIRRLDPDFDGTFPKAAPAAAPSASHATSPAASGFVTPAPVPAPAPKSRSVVPKPPVRPNDVMASIGAPMEEHVRAATAIIGLMPESLRAAARDPNGAQAVIYALLLSPEPELRARQDRRLAMHSDGTNIAADAARMVAGTSDLPPEARLPLVDMCVPALATLSRPQYDTFRANVEALAAADEEIDLFEYTLLRSLMRNLDARFGRPNKGSVQYYSLAGLGAECSVVLSMLARTGTTNPAQARAAFDAACVELREPRARLEFLDAADCPLSAVDEALNRLASAAPNLKRLVVLACLTCLVDDGLVAPDEAELFRSISYALDVPVPFFGTTAA